MDTIKYYWRHWLWSTAVNRIITINFIVWMAIWIGTFVLPRGAEYVWVSMFVLPPFDVLLPRRCWTVLTYMFAHVDFLHMLVNMMWLMLFGRLLTLTRGSVRMVAVYIYGGLAGAAAFLIYNAFQSTIGPYVALGASCSVLAVTGAVAVLTPKFEVDLLLFGRVRVIWVAVAAVVFLVLLAPSAPQTVAHAAGFIMGAAYALLLRRGIDITTPTVRLWEHICSPHRRKSPTRGKASDSERFDQLLAKVNRSGYQSLSPAERQELFNLTQKIKR